MSGARRTAPVPPLPDALLAPLLDAAAEVLGSLEPDEVPVPLRRLVGFDRRGLGRGPARQQLRRALESDDGFRDRTVERFTQRAEIARLLESWTLDETLAQVTEAAERDDLPLLASALYATRPGGWSFALGVVCAVFERARRAREAGEQLKARELQIATLEESQRRADEALSEAEERLARLDRELRDERHRRRGREVEAAKDVETAQQRAEEAERALARARVALESADTRARREADRARRAETDLRTLREERERGVSGDAGRGPVLRRDDVKALVDAAELARRLADGLDGVAEHARALLPGKGGRVDEAASERSASRREAVSPVGAREPRARPPLPPGMVEDDPAALEAMLRGSGVVLVVDGYNVSMLAWGDAPVAEQRERLMGALAELQARTRCEVTVVFDGAEVEGVRPPGRPRARVVFSAPGEEADAVIVREVAALPSRVPVVVASSDGWVRNHVEREGARVVASQTLLTLLRR